MTVGNKVHQALASLRGLEGQFEMFALDTEDQQAKQMYNQCRQTIGQMVQQLSSRVNYMEQEEPSYKITGGPQQQGGGGGGMQSNTMTNATTSFTSGTGGMGGTQTGNTGTRNNRMR